MRRRAIGTRVVRRRELRRLGVLVPGGSLDFESSVRVGVTGGVV
jgi:hypothetical protein